MVEERAAEGAVKEIVGQHIVLGIGPERQFRAVVIVHDERGRVRPGDELIHLAAVDLQLLLIIAMPGIAGGLIDIGIGFGAERTVRQIAWKTRVDRWWLRLVFSTGGSLS